jgi:hypothetical protein
MSVYQDCDDDADQQTARSVDRERAPREHGKATTLDDRSRP